MTHQAKEGKIAQLADHRPKDRESWNLQQAMEGTHLAANTLYNLAYLHPEIRWRGTRKWIVWKDALMELVSGEKSA